jgi:hypothetical protein
MFPGAISATKNIAIETSIMVRNMKTIRRMRNLAIEHSLKQMKFNYKPVPRKADNLAT